MIPLNTLPNNQEQIFLLWTSSWKNPFLSFFSKYCLFKLLAIHFRAPVLRRQVERSWWGLVFCRFPWSSGGDNTSSCLSSFYLQLSPWNSPLLFSSSSIYFSKLSWSCFPAFKLHSSFSFSSFLACCLHHHFLEIVHCLYLTTLAGGGMSRLNGLWTQRTDAHNSSLLVVVHLHTSSLPFHPCTCCASSCSSQIGWWPCVSPIRPQIYAGIAFPSSWHSVTF